MSSTYPGIKLEQALGTWEDKIKHLSSYAHVVHTPAKLVISRRRKNENVYKMSKNEKCTRKACKNTILHRQICKFVGFLLPSSSWLLKLPSSIYTVLVRTVWSLQSEAVSLSFPKSGRILQGLKTLNLNFTIKFKSNQYFSQQVPGVISGLWQKYFVHYPFIQISSLKLYSERWELVLKISCDLLDSHIYCAADKYVS